jgi:hypothetical protein
VRAGKEFSDFGDFETRAIQSVPSGVEGHAHGEIDMKTALVAYAGSLVTLLVFDAVWLGLVARTFYRDQLGEMMLPSPNLGVAAVFYLFFAVAVVVLAVFPAIAVGLCVDRTRLWFDPRAGGLRNIRHHQPRNTEELAADDEPRRPCLGWFRHRDDRSGRLSGGAGAELNSCSLKF